MLRSAGPIALLLTLAGCATLGPPLTSRLAANLSASVLEQDDVQTVRDGAPAYLLAIEGLIADDPENPALLLTRARLYIAYAFAFAFVDDEERAQRLFGRSLDYARRALCL